MTLFLLSCHERPAIDSSELKILPVKKDSSLREEPPSIKSFLEKNNKTFEKASNTHFYSEIDHKKDYGKAISKSDFPLGINKQLEASFPTYYLGQYPLSKELLGLFWLQIDGYDFTRHTLSVVNSKTFENIPKAIFLSEHQGDAGEEIYVEAWIFDGDKDGDISILADSYEIIQPDSELENKKISKSTELITFIGSEVNRIKNPKSPFYDRKSYYLEDD